MIANNQRFRLGSNGPGTRVPVSGILGKLLTALASAVVLIVAFMISLVIFAAVASAVMITGAYLWWKTRALRKQMREHAPGGRVIDGEVIRDES
jgi:Flp pilus assembly protein TadB